jgi:hypothetical protein
VTTVRHVVIAVTALALGSACDRSPTGPPQAPAPSSPLVSSSSSPPTGPLACSGLSDKSVTPLIGLAGGAIRIGPRCVEPQVSVQGPSYDRRSNYAVAW